MKAKKARTEEADAIRKKIEEQEAKNAHALKKLSKKRNEFPVMWCLFLIQFCASDRRSSFIFLFLLFFIIYNTSSYALVDVRQGRHCPSQLSSHLAYKVLLQAPWSGRLQRDCCSIRPWIFDNASHHFVISFCGCAFERRNPSGEDVVLDPW